MKDNRIFYGFPERSKRPNLDPSWLKAQLLRGVSITQIAKESGYSRQAIYDFIRRYKLTIPKRNDIDPEWLKQQKEKGRTDKEIA